MANKLAIVMYHYVRPISGSRYPGIKGLEIELFKQQLDYLGERFRFVSCADVRDAVYRGRALPDDAILLTFDDGYLDHYSYVFPQLKLRGIPGFFSMPGRVIAEHRLLDVNRVHFVLASASTEVIIQYLKQRIRELRSEGIPSYEELYSQLAVANRFDTSDTVFIKRVLQNALPEAVRNMLAEELFAMHISMSESAFVDELYMTMDQIKVMIADGMEFGVHGYDHKWLGKLPESEMNKDLEKAVGVFHSVLPDKWCMCFPYGSSSDLAIAKARSLGAGIGFSTEVAFAQIDRDSPMLLPRLDTNDFPPKSKKYLEAK